MSEKKQIDSRRIGGGSGTNDSVAVYDFSSLTGMTYSPFEVEAANGTSYLKPQFASHCIFAAVWSTTINLSYSRDGGKLEPSSWDGIGSTGPVGVTNGALLFPGVTFAKLFYEPYKNLGPRSVNSFLFRFSPNYSGTPSNRQFIFESSRTYGAVNNGYRIAHATDNNLYQEASPYTTETAFLSQNTAMGFSAGQWYEMEFNFQNATTSPVSNTYIGATRRMSNTTATGMINWVVDHMGFGANAGNAGTDIANFQLKDFMAFDSSPLNAGTTRMTGYTVPLSLYLTSNPAFETAATTMNAVTSANVVYKQNGSDVVKVQVRVGGQLKYYNGAAWVNSDGSYAQANTVADFESNIALLTGGSVAFRFLLHSENGNTTPYVDSLTVEYT